LGVAYVYLGEKDLAIDEYGVLKTLDQKSATSLFQLIRVNVSSWEPSSSRPVNRLDTFAKSSEAVTTKKQINTLEILGPPPSANIIPLIAYIDCRDLKYVELFGVPGGTVTGTLWCKDKVTILSWEEDWVRIRTEHDQVGYVSRWFISKRE
jgi:hypothetical protein